MIGIQLDRPVAELVGKGIDAGRLINVTADSVVRLLPSLTYSDTTLASWLTCWRR